MLAWWAQRPRWLRLTTWVGVMAAVVGVSNFGGAITKASAAMPVLWFQMIDYIDARAQKRDQQMDLVRIDAISADLTGIGNLKQILASRIIDIDMRLRIMPNDAVLQRAKADAQSDLDDADRKEHNQRCKLSLLTDGPGGAC